MEWFIFSTQWYIVLFIIGVIFFPLVRFIFPKFYDYGYGLSKAIGIGLLSYAIFALGTARILPFTKGSLILLLTLVTAGSLYSLYKKPLKLSKRIAFILFEEVLFLAAFFFWAYIRSRQPDIRGLEKFMDFGFINSVLRGEYFPSKDMWLANNSINYYYFGHITGAVLTKLSSIPSYISYNLILAQLFGLGILSAFSVTFNIAWDLFKKNIKKSFAAGLLATFIVNIGGNLHTMYAFTNGYKNDEPVPLWATEAKYRLSDIGGSITELINRLPDFYWYPNATRFIPFTIHEFPIYSYVVADLHGHVFAIPFVITTIALLYTVLTMKAKGKRLTAYAIGLGFMISMHLMTNAFDLPIYLLLTGIVLFAKFGLDKKLLKYGLLVILSFVIFNIPFSRGFEPFASGVGVNCVGPGLTQSINNAIAGTFLESRIILENNCTVSAWWQVITLWGFFWFNFIFLSLFLIQHRKKLTVHEQYPLILFSMGTLLILIPEFVYMKDIYPSHFRANTMFKLGYQAFIMMGIASGLAFPLIKEKIRKSWISRSYIILFIPLFFFIAIYPAFAIDSYYPASKEAFKLNGQDWINTVYSEYAEIIDYFNENVDGQPVILEAQGDSYTDYNVVSAYTGLPTVAGWWVHEWLWRGDSDAVGALAGPIQEFYTTMTVEQMDAFVMEHNIEYVVLGRLEREKYGVIDETRFEALGKEVFRSTDGSGIIYQIPVDRL